MDLTASLTFSKQTSNRKFWTNTDLYKHGVAYNLNKNYYETISELKFRLIEIFYLRLTVRATKTRFKERKSFTKSVCFGGGMTEPTNTT